MKRWMLGLLIALFLFPLSASFASPDVNVDAGGGDAGGARDKSSFWVEGRDGVRVTIVRTKDGAIVGTPMDFSNQQNTDVKFHFGKNSKLQYLENTSLKLQPTKYISQVPLRPLPLIVSATAGSNIEAVRNYFRDEGTIRYLASVAGLRYEALISGNYELLLEPVAYFQYRGVMVAASATEAAILNQKESGKLRYYLVDLTHRNLPLSMFLQREAFGIKPFTGNPAAYQGDAEIIQRLGVGSVRFRKPPGSPHGDSSTLPGQITQPAANVITYRADTLVITSISASSDEEHPPEDPAYVNFSVNGSRYQHRFVLPAGGSQLAYFKWRTPKTPGRYQILCDSNVTLSTGSQVYVLDVLIVDEKENEPPDPRGRDRNDAFRFQNPQSLPSQTFLTWGEYSAVKVPHFVLEKGKWVDKSYYRYDLVEMKASLSGSLSIDPDERAETAKGKQMKSGYGFTASFFPRLTSNASNDATTPVQRAVMTFPEFHFQTYNRFLERTGSGFEFRVNVHSHFGRRVHFTPVWWKDGEYEVFLDAYDAWTPAGMLRAQRSDKLMINGSVYDDWKVVPTRP